MRLDNTRAAKQTSPSPILPWNQTRKIGDVTNNIIYFICLFKFKQQSSIPEWSHMHQDIQITPTHLHTRDFPK